MKRWLLLTALGGIFCLVIVWSLGVTETSRAQDAQAAQPLVEAGQENNWQNLPQQMIEDRAFRHYATVSRTDGTFRQMFVDEVSIPQILETGQLPRGAFLMMESWRSDPDTEGTNFTSEWQGSEFSYGSFSPLRPSFSTGPNLSCTNCHRGAESEVNGMFTWDMLRTALQQGQVMTTLCDRGGRSPCEVSVYETFTPLGEGQ